MSKQIAASFIEKARTDGAIQQKLMELGPDASVADLLDVAAVIGFQFTENDLFAAAKDDAEARLSRGEELSELELDAAAGGVASTHNLSITIITRPINITAITRF